MTIIFQKITITYHPVPVSDENIIEAKNINNSCDFQNSQPYQFEPEKQYQAII